MRASNRSYNRIRAGLRISAAGLVVGLATVSAAVLPAQMANAATLSVTNCSNSGAGSLRAEVAAATSKSTITFASTVTSCSPVLLTSGPITITNNVRIDGPGVSSLAVSGGSLVGVFSVSSGVTDATISGLTIENGNAGPGADGANDNVSIPGNNLTEDVDAGGNGGDGAGIYNAGSLALTSDTTSGSTTGSGGNPGSDDVTVTGEGDIFNLYNGIGGNGGGIDNSGSFSMSNSTTTGNAAEVGTYGGKGGGIYNDGTATITASTLSANSAGGGATSRLTGAR